MGKLLTGLMCVHVLPPFNDLLANQLPVSNIWEPLLAMLHSQMVEVWSLVTVSDSMDSFVILTSFMRKGV